MTFLFDIGRVLLDFDFETSLHRLFTSDVSNPAERLSLLLERKDEFEAGSINVADYTDWAIRTMGIQSTPAEFHHAWQQIFTPNDPMWECVRTLAADGHRLILFSNTNAIHCPWIFDEFPEFSLFDGAVLSFEAGSIKPHPEIYQHAISTHSLVPSEVCYIDDLPQNIATGLQLGFRSWQYDLKDHAAFESWLSENLNSQL
ncbi:MAG: HAD family phosphatase [Luteolibacter sp.]